MMTDLDLSLSVTDQFEWFTHFCLSSRFLGKVFNPGCSSLTQRCIPI